MTYRTKTKEKWRRIRQSSKLARIASYSDREISYPCPDSLFIQAASMNSNYPDPNSYTILVRIGDKPVLGQNVVVANYFSPAAAGCVIERPLL